MSKLQLSLACAGYDRTRALFDGRVSIDGVDIIPTVLEPEEAFHRAFKYGEFDITEISMSSHTVMTARGEAQYVGVPAFLSRVFRHSGIYINTSKGITRPEDLRGKIIGVPEYQITANVWIRGILSDDYGVSADQVHWRRGGIEQPGRGEQPLRPGGLRCVAAHAVGARRGAPSPGALQVFRLRTRAMGSETLNPILPMAVSFMIGVQACGQRPRRSTLRQSWLRCAPRASLRPAGLTAACARSVPVAAVPRTGCVEE